MSASYLIDGYNLLHAMGVLCGPVGPGGLEKARMRLLGLLAGGFGNEAHAVTVVFDAAHAPPHATAEQVFRGVQVRFAVAQDEADDLIELLLEEDSSPRRMTLVSDDHRLQRAARRRACCVQSCDEFLEWLDRHRRDGHRPRAEPPEKRDKLSETEVQNWLAEFADLGEHPHFKELFDPFDFEKDV